MPVSMPLIIFAPVNVFNACFGVGVGVASVVSVDAAALVLLIATLGHCPYVKPGNEYAGEHCGK